MIFFRAIALLFLLGSAHGAWAGELFPDKAASLPALVRARAENFYGGVYVVPNEEDFHLFGDSLRGKTGALVSVGTFRSLESASRGEFNHLVMADIDPGIVAFNRMQIKALQEAATPKEFVALLLGRADWADELPDLDDADLLEKWEEFRKRKTPEEKAKGAFRKAVDGLLRRKDGQEARFRYVDALMKFSARPPGEAQPFLRDPARFLRLKRMAERGQMNAIITDYAGPSLKRLADRLRERGVRVGVLDVSNAPDYFLDNPGKRRNFLENLQSLPFTEDGRVNFTSVDYDRLRSSGDDMWEYVSAPASDYKRAVGSLVGKQDYNYLFARKEIRPHVVQRRKVEPCPKLFSGIQ